MKAKENIRNLAVFDFDGTLSKGFISMAFLDYIVAKKGYSRKEYDEQMRLVEELKNEHISYDNWCEKWGEVWGAGLKGQARNKIRDCAKEFFETFRSNIYSQSHELINCLQWKGYEIMFLSVGAREVIDLAAAELGAKNVFGTKLEFKSGVYTGKVLTGFHKSSGKEKFLSEFLRREKYDDTIGFGDSDSDIGFMKLLGKQVALNPSPKLREHCEKNGWSYFKLDENGVVRKIEKIV